MIKTTTTGHASIGLFSRFSLALACVLALTSCATANHGKMAANSQEAAEMPDPMEGFNRGMFKVNDALDQGIIEPVARGYRAVAPQPVRSGVTNFLHNLKSPIYMANRLLQGDMKGFTNDAVRFVVNSTVGAAGLFDVAGANGYKYAPSDFGQTLGKWGVGHGAYLVLPVLGPSSVRDGTGMLVDSFADPLNIYLYNTGNQGWVYARWGATLLSSREELLDAVADLRKHSFDYYAAMRSAYFQHRQALLNDGKTANSAGPAGTPEHP